MSIKYFICGPSMPKLNSNKIKSKCEQIEKFISRGDDETVNMIKNLCSYIVLNLDEITLDKLKNTTLVNEIKSRSLNFRKNDPKIN